MPPAMTDQGEPSQVAARPASSSPSCGPPMKKIMFTEVMRPRRRFGVMSCRIVCRRTVLTESATPTAASASQDSQNRREAPNTTVANP